MISLLPGVFQSSPAVVGGMVFMGSVNSVGSALYVLNAATGTRLWSFASGGYFYDSPALAGHVVYVGDDAGFEYALNARKGARLWSFQTGSSISFSSPAEANGVLYLGSESLGTNLCALNARTGVKLWSFATGNLVDSSPAVAGGMVYIGDDNGNVYAFHLPHGSGLS